MKVLREGRKLFQVHRGSERLKVLDTDLLIDFFRGSPEAISKMSALQEGEDGICTTILNAQELLIGFTGRTKGQYRDVALFLSRLEVLDYSFKDADAVVEVINKLKSSGGSVGVFDEIIAGICISRGATIVTKNIKHFGRVNRLKIEKW